MQFNQGASVFTIDGHVVGRIDRVVIETKTDQVTHVVVRKGHLFTKDKVVPVDAIAAGQGERIVLRVDLNQLERLPDFEEKHVEETHLNIPEDTVAIKEGVKIIACDDKYVGKLEQVLTSFEAGRVTYFLVARGLLQKEKKLIPVSWIDHMGEDEVFLLVGSRTIERLPVIEPA